MHGINASCSLVESVASPKSGWSRGDTFTAAAIFLVALGFHAWGATRGWHQANLSGNNAADEFRQTQTAVSALFIQRDHDFSLAYPTPVLGKPWSVPLEFPLYQWAVVGLSNATAMPLIQAGRMVSLMCFYLGLPALYLLLARPGLSPSRRLLVLAFVLSCPLYIYYAQTFLIETMAWMFGLWFLLGFLHAVERRPGLWWLLAAVGGTGTALVKITTFLFFLLPAAALVAWLLWRERPARSGGSWSSWRSIGLQGLAALVLPCVATLWWTRYTDMIKAKSVAGNFLNSWHQHGYIFGIGRRFSRELWSQHLTNLFQDIAPLPVLVVALIALLATRRRWQLAIVLVACFFAVQEIFPILYAWHKYYFVANAVALMVAIGLAVDGLFSSRLPRLAAWAVVAALLGLQAWTFGRIHYPILTDISTSDNTAARLLHCATRPDDVLVIAGADWAALVPFYSERRALMIRSEVQADMGFVEKAFASQAGAGVAALMLQGDQCLNQPLLDLAIRHFHLDPRMVFKSTGQHVYLNPQRREQAMAAFESYPPTPGIDLAPESQLDPARYNDREILWDRLPSRPQEYFAAMTPRPWKVYAKFGIGQLDFRGRTMFGASADTKLWFKVEPGHREVFVECAMFPEAYTDRIPAGDRSDGVEFVLSEFRADGTVRQLATLYLNPAQLPADRNLHRLEFAGEIAAGADILLETRPGPHGSYARDWALLGTVTIK